LIASDSKDIYNMTIFLFKKNAVILNFPQKKNIKKNNSFQLW